MLAGLCVGFGYAWSVLLRPIASGSGWSDADVALTFTAFMTTGAVGSLVAGRLQPLVTPRALILLGAALFGSGMALLGSVHTLLAVYGFAALAGFGMGVVYPGATMSNLIRFFPDRSGLVSGLLSAGYGLGSVVWAPVAVALIDSLGLEWALRVMGAGFFIALAALSGLVATAPATPPAGDAAAVTPSRDVGWRGMLRTADFYVLALVFVTGMVSGMMIIGQASPIAQALLDISPRSAGFIVSLLAVGMVAGKIVWGALSDRVGRTTVFVALFVVSAVALVILTGAAGYFAVAACVTMIGTCYGGFMALMGPATAQAFGPTYLGVNFGIMFFTVAISSFIGPRIAAVVSVANGGSYSQAFVIAAAISAAGLVLIGCHTLLLRRTASAQGPPAVAE